MAKPVFSMANQPDMTTLLNGANAPFIAELYSKYLENPGSVDPSWQGFFAELRDDRTAIDADVRGASWAPRQLMIGNGAAETKANGKNGAHAESVSLDEVRAATLDSVRALMLI